MNRRAAFTGPLHLRQTDPEECGKVSGISLLSATRKIYVKVLINRVAKSTEMKVGKQQCVLSIDRSYADQFYVIRQLCEKSKDKNEVTYVSLMNLDKAYDRVDREALRKCWRTVKYRKRLKLAQFNREYV